MCRLPWTWILAVVAASIPGAAFAGHQAGEPSDPPEPASAPAGVSHGNPSPAPARPEERDWGRALRNNDKEAFAHLVEAGADEQPFLREALRHAEAMWRMAAAQRLGDLQARWATDILQARTQDRHPGVAISALLALRRLGAGGGVKPFRTLVYPGADLDKKEAAGGALEFVLLSKDGARNVSGFYEQALDDLGWARQRAIGDSELPLRCRSPWGGLYGRGPTTFLVIVCGAPTPGEQAVIHLKVRGASASKVLGAAFEKVLKDPGVR